MGLPPAAEAFGRFFRQAFRVDSRPGKGHGRYRADGGERTPRRAGPRDAAHADDEPGSFSRQLAPAGVNDAGTVAEEVIPVLLERLEKYGAASLCPGGRMMDADRAVLNALVLAKGRVWNVEKRPDEMRPQWESYQRRVERLCRGPE